MNWIKNCKKSIINIWKTLWKNIPVVLLILVYSLFSHHSDSFGIEEVFSQARENGRLANEGFLRSLNYVKAWLKYRDPNTGLIPKNLDWEKNKKVYMKNGKDIWNAKDTAADNYSYMVLATAITDRSLFNGPMVEMLLTEKKLTNRIGNLPDTYSFSQKDFLYANPNIDRIMFGASEYVKDGLLATVEWIGITPWYDRMIEILNDMWCHAYIDTPYGKLVSRNKEVNGEMLQTLSRIYWTTGERKYLEWAIRIGDYYLLGNNHPTRYARRLKLRDHGCEIISGLCELYATVYFALPEKRQSYQQPIHEMLDRILEVGRNKDGLFYNKINPREGKEITNSLADTWGYTLNGYYTVYLIDKTESYKAAVLKVLNNLHHYDFSSWGNETMDSIADSIEGALNLYNRESVPSVANWIDNGIRELWNRQQPDGLIEGWHCDGNFARTTLMYCLWKTKGVTIRPWNKNVMFGAVKQGEKLLISLIANNAWEGKIIFDSPRHKLNMKMPLDWPRINQLPEWFTFFPGKSYTLINLTKNFQQDYTGKELINGVNIYLKPGEEQRLQLN